MSAFNFQEPDSKLVPVRMLAKTAFSEIQNEAASGGINREAVENFWRDFPDATNCRIRQAWNFLSMGLRRVHPGNLSLAGFSQQSGIP